MKYKHATWLKLYRDEEGAFARLPFTARAYAKQLLLLCDDAGRIDVGEGEDHVKLLVDTAGFRMGATRGDRRMMAMMFPLLFEEQYLVRRGRFVVVRNFVAAQRRWSDDDDATTASRPSDDDATTEQPTGDEAATKRERPSNEAATETKLTPRKHDIADASARARARSSVPSSSETIRVDTAPREREAEGAAPRCPTVERPGAINGLDACAELRGLSNGRLQTGASPAQAVVLGELLTSLGGQHRRTDLVPLLGAYAAAGGFAWMTKRKPTTAWFLENDGANLTDSIELAVAWDADGRPPVTPRDAAPAAAPPPPAPPKVVPIQRTISQAEQARVLREAMAQHGVGGRRAG